MFGSLNRDLIFLSEGEFSALRKGISMNFRFVYTRSLLISFDASGLTVYMIGGKSCIKTGDNDLETGQFDDDFRELLIFFM